MKKLLIVLTICLLYSLTPTQAQYTGVKNGLSFSFVQLDHYSPYTGDFKIDSDNRGNGVMLAYHRSLGSNFLNLEVPLRLAEALVFDKSNPFGDENLLVGLDVLVQLQYNNGSNFIVPYLSAGLGGWYLDNDGTDFQAPVGIGLDFRLAKQVYLHTRSEFRFSFSDNRNNWNHIIGLKFLLGSPEIEEVPVVPVIIDTDSDGISDVEDKCPTEAGLAAFDGCPDTDSDGIADGMDDCPTVAGLTAFNGCPDTDSDGIVDSKDDCPNEAGPASNNGCPFADSDGDGVIDEEDDCPNSPGTAANKGCPDTDNDGVIDKNDKCPTTAGPASNNGCPELKQEEKEVLKFAASAIQFNTGSAGIKTESFLILDQVAEILNKYPDYKCSISGHTDSQGSSEFNQNLSEQRAKSCYDYLIKKDVAASRLSYKGYGESEPIADNKTAKGRKENRRVVFKIDL